MFPGAHQYLDTWTYLPQGESRVVASAARSMQRAFSESKHQRIVRFLMLLES